MDNDDTDTETVVDRQENHTSCIDGCNCKPLLVNFQYVHNEIQDLISEKKEIIAYNKIDILESNAKVSLISKLLAEYKAEESISIQSNEIIIQILNKNEDEITEDIKKSEIKIGKAETSIETLQETMQTLRYRFLYNEDDEDDDNDEDD